MLSSAQKKSLLRLARQGLAALWSDEPALAGPVEASCEPASGFAGVFVSIYVNAKLRGCIGNLNLAAPLEELIMETAQAAASHDPRFAPVRAEELPEVKIEISLLHQMEAVHAPEDIVIGRDGLIVRSGKKHGLLLPQVAPKREWDAITFLEQTCRKADLPLNAWQAAETEVFRFRAEVFSDQEE
jgi:AmmeMemoRadiSam system protein A